MTTFFAFLPSIGLPELLIILFIVILVFGASRLPELGKGIGKGIRNFKDATKDGLNDTKKLD
ncbi:MAG: twin-arginine translocase TatA/TatE family subunit [Acidobacteria bacterium]|jgi:sec-independent protein translocase protein TatA|nr:twin-arginine translocase TatA/TatE family subunit [Acidobacteriota bacterium]